MSPATTASKKCCAARFSGKKRKIHQRPTIATSTSAAIVNAKGRDFRVVSGGGSRSDIQSSPALRASEQPLSRRQRRKARKIEAASHSDTKNVTEVEAAKQCVAVGLL